MGRVVECRPPAAAAGGAGDVSRGGGGGGCRRWRRIRGGSCGGGIRRRRRNCGHGLRRRRGPPCSPPRRAAGAAATFLRRCILRGQGYDTPAGGGARARARPEGTNLTVSRAVGVPLPAPFPLAAPIRGGAGPAALRLGHWPRRFRPPRLPHDSGTTPRAPARPRHRAPRSPRRPAPLGAPVLGRRHWAARTWTEALGRPYLDGGIGPPVLGRRPRAFPTCRPPALAYTGAVAHGAAAVWRQLPVGPGLHGSASQLALAYTGAAPLGRPHSGPACMGAAVVCCKLSVRSGVLAAKPQLRDSLGASRRVRMVCTPHAWGVGRGI
jgi:hypothetical protein